MSEDLEFCAECMEDFRFDDTGGYNPPCQCGHGLCRSCCEAERRAEAEWDDADGFEPEDWPG